jgi:histidinol-phosphate aminotransferase
MPRIFAQPHIQRISGYTPGEQPQSGGFIKLNTNENPYPPSPLVIDAIANAARSGLQKYPDPMANAFRNQAASLLGVDPNWILCGNGSDDLLTIATRTFVGSGQMLRMPRPSYVLYQTLAAIQEASVDVVGFESDWTIANSFFETPPHVRLCFLPNPNSPSGTMIPIKILRRQIAQMKCPLVLDEAYVDFADEHGIDLVREFEHVIVTRTLSKSYGLAGLRFGYAVARPELISQMAKVKDSYNCDTLSIAGATAAITDQAWLQSNRQKIVATRQRMTIALEKRGFFCLPSQANFVWCQHPSIPSRTLYEQLKERRILVRWMNYAGTMEGLRISVGEDSEIDTLINVLAQLILQAS